MKILFKYYKRHWIFLALYVLMLTIQAVLAFFNAMFIARMISAIMDHPNYGMALLYAGLSLAMLAGAVLSEILNTYFFKQLENRTKIDIQQHVLRSALEIQMSEYDKMGSGIIVTRLTSDIDRLSTAFKELTRGIFEILKRVAYVLYIFFLNVWLGLFLLGMIFATSAFYALRVHYLKKMKPGVNNAAENVNSKIIEVIRGVKDIKTLNCVDNTLKILKKDQLVYKKRDDKEWYVGATLANMAVLVENIFNFLFIFLCLYFLRLDGLTPVVFYTCFLYKDHVLDFARQSGDLYYRFGEIAVYAGRIFKIAEPETYQIDRFGDQNIKNYSGKVIFENVNFSYDGDKNVLQNASFMIEPKQTVAFVGESGCGKTTIINLIAHLYYKNSGNIFYDDVPIEAVGRDFIKENIAVVNQFPYIFNISIRDNFRIIKNDITDKEILSLCKKTKIYSHIKSLPDGLDSIIGENGCQFSGGQRQKLCIARALARNVKILIFDEATSALDNTSQSEIMKIIENLKRKMTIILIAHRLSTITYADCIYLLKDGVIVASGTHEELYENNEYYRHLYINALSQQALEDKKEK